MNPWKILEVERTADAREIKRAYARKLKVTKPDEKPAEFQALHQAYKSALDYAARREAKRQMPMHPAAETLENSIHNNEALANPIHLEPTDSAITEQIQESIQDDSDNEGEIALRTTEHEQLIAQVEALLGKKSVLNDPLQWHFLANSTYILEDDFNWKLGRKVFELFSEYGQVRVRGARGHYYSQEVPTDIVGFCDEIFSWKSRAYYLQMEFGHEFCEDLLAQMDRYEDGLTRNKPNKGLRGGTFIRGSESAKSKPTGASGSGSSGGGINFSYVFFALFVLLNVARCAQQAPGY